MSNIADSPDYTNAKAVLGSIEKNHRSIKKLLKAKVNIISKVQLKMDEKARTKTPLDEEQQRTFNVFTGMYAQEGGRLQESLVRIELIQNDLHNEDTQPFMLSLLLLQRHQNSAIDSLRRMITSGEKALSSL